MSPAKDVVIVSVFGRGQWLASELSRQHNLNVTLVDVSEQLGRWSAEDWEGPFGLLQTEELTQTQLGRLSHEDYSDRNSQGLTLWLKNGPVDFMGPITQVWLDSDGPMHFLKDYLVAWDIHRGKNTTKNLARQIVQKPFKQSWMVHLAHQLAATSFSDNAHAVLSGSPLPMFSPLYTRRSTRKGYSKSLEWAASKGVEVLSRAKLLDLEMDSRYLRSIEVQAEERSGAIRSDQWIWMLSSMETHFVMRDKGQNFFPKGPLEPQWAWLRYRFNIDLSTYEGAVPGHFVMIKDNNLPWTHDNLLVAVSVVTGGAFDIWSRFPYHQRFQRSSLDQYATELESVLKDRFPDFPVSLAGRPQEYEYEYDQLGPSVFPVYDRQSLQRLQKKKYQNVQYGGPEAWDRLDWTGRFQHDVNQIPQVVAQYNALKKKEKDSDSEIHPS